MSKIGKSFSTAFIVIALYACQSGENNYSVHSSGYDPSAKSTDYQIYPVQSQLMLSIYPKDKKGAPAVVRVSLDEGNLYVEGGELRGGQAVANMANPILEMPATLSSNSAFSDPLGKKMLEKSDFEEAKLEIARVTSVFDEETGSTHLIALNLKLRNKKRGLQIPARVVVNQEHVAVVSAQMFTVDLTKWGMQPEEGGWNKEAVLALQIRGDVSKK